MSNHFFLIGSVSIVCSFQISKCHLIKAIRKRQDNISTVSFIVCSFPFNAPLFCRAVVAIAVSAFVAAPAEVSHKPYSMILISPKVRLAISFIIFVILLESSCT
jgi:hypothetical protein